MFARREKPSFGKNLKGFVWPSMGWRRTSHYLFHRVGRIKDSPYSIAAGFACGAAISFTPFVGLHFIFGGLWAWLIRANIISSAFGTAVGNPWTFPFIWTWLYKCGRWAGVGNERSEISDPASQDFSALFGRMFEAALSGDLNFFNETAAPVFWPMLVASVPTAAAIWILCYVPLNWAVADYQKRRIERRGSGLLQPSPDE